MNRRTAARTNNFFLTLAVAGALFALVHERVRGWLVDLRYFSGVESSRQRDHEEAVRSFKEAARLAVLASPEGLPGLDLDAWIGSRLPERAAEAWLEAGKVLEENLEDFHAAEEAYRESLALDPGAGGLAEGAADRLSRVADRSSKSASLKARGKELLDDGHFREAQGAFEKAVRLDPGDREGRYLLKAALASGRASVGKAQAAELLSLSLRVSGFEGVRIQYAPYWARGSGVNRESLILDVPQGDLRIPEFILPCVRSAGQLLDFKLSFDLGRLVLRRHPGSAPRPPTFAAFRNDEIYDIPVDTLRQFRMGQLTPAELVRRLAPPTN